MFDAIKNLFKKIINDTPSSVDKKDSKEDTFEPSQIELLPVYDETESVIKKSKKRTLKYRK
jgi:hypothetical protein